MTEPNVMADKIAKLLRLAESTKNEAEADAFLAKAQSLMITYAIDEQMLASARGEQAQDEVVEEHIDYTGIFQSATFDIGSAIVRANNCKPLISKIKHRKPHATRLHIVGFKSDIARIRLLDASLQIQCATALSAWWKTNGDKDWMSGMQKYKARREFIMGFASGLSAKLAAAKKEGVAESVKHEATRADVTEEVATKSVELVLRSREEQVKDWYDKKYGNSTRKVSRNYSSGGWDARSAGSNAGRNADTGTSRLGQTKAIR
jgi:hypothetical protein